MVKFFVRLFAIIGLLAVIIIAGGIFLASRLLPSEPELPGNVVLTVDLRSGLPDSSANSALAPLVGEESSLRDVILTLTRAEKDPHVHGLVAYIDGNALSLPQAQELRDAVHSFRSSGRFAMVASTGLGDLGDGTISYYLASAFDLIGVQPLGGVGLTGIAARQPFARSALEKWKLSAEGEKRGAYKTAPEIATESNITPANREMTEWLVGDMGSQVLAGIATDRNLPQARVQSLLDQGPLTGEAAKAAGLIDRIAYVDEIEDAALERAGKGAELVTIDDYHAGAGNGWSADDPTVALIQGEGNIVPGSAGPGGPFDSELMAADDISAGIADAVSSGAKAIILRLNTGGGSASASETIRRAIQKAQKAGVKVVVSMADVAASGGYWVASAADRIVAEPATLTGSIGVFSGKIVTDAFWQELGVNWAETRFGANAGMWGGGSFSAAEQERLGEVTDVIYHGFISRVAEARHLTPEAVEAIAEGRVWTGRQAREKGLVDVLGGLDTAIDEARRLANVEGDVRLEAFPKPSGIVEELLAMVSNPGLHAAIKSAASLYLAATESAESRAVRMEPVGLNGN